MRSYPCLQARIAAALFAAFTFGSASPSVPTPAQTPAARGSVATAPRQVSAGKPAATKPAIAPSEIVEIAKVVDGDTIHVRRRGGVEKLRLLSVDTEERLRSGSPPSSTKPETVFGEECALWAQRFFADLAPEGETPRIGLHFPGGLEKKDVYGRLLCHVILPDGRDYNRMLVEIGKSPYFNKYGNSDVDHAGFVAAQQAARECELGIWNPKTNTPATPGAPAAKRPYRELLAWWDARARAIDDFRARHAATPDAVVDAEDPLALARAAGSGREVEVFGEVDKLFDEAPRGGEASGAPSTAAGAALSDWTVLLRTSSKEKAVRIRIPGRARSRFATFDLPALTREFRQNHLYVRGRLHAGPRGFELACEDPACLRRAGPEPEPVDGATR